MKSVLLYNVYIKGGWRRVTGQILKVVPHDHIVINISIDWYKVFLLPYLFYRFKKLPKVVTVTFTFNKRKLGEVTGFNRLRKSILPKHYSILTYSHGKGVSKQRNRNVDDWVELMRYFVIERLDLCQKAFINNSYYLFGVNLGFYNAGEERNGPFRFSDFHYSGNFVSVNLDQLEEKFMKTPCDNDYFGVEGFWGKLCDPAKAFCAHLSSLKIKNHYLEPYPPEYYK